MTEIIALTSVHTECCSYLTVTASLWPHGDTSITFMPQR